MKLRGLLTSTRTSLLQNPLIVRESETTVVLAAEASVVRAGAVMFVIDVALLLAALAAGNGFVSS